MLTLFQSGGADYVNHMSVSLEKIVLNIDNNLESENPKTPKTSRHQHHKKELNMKVKLVVGK